MQIKVFISSVQAEFRDERWKLFEYIRTDALLGKFFSPYLFEAQPAQNISAQKAYLTEVAECHIYIGLFGSRYGYEDEQGISPTEREYDTATAQHKHRLIYITQLTGRKKRHPKQAALIAKAEQSVVRKSFSNYEELQEAVYNSLLHYLEEKGYISSLPFDSTYRPQIGLEALDEKKIEDFCFLAHTRRGFPIPYSRDAIPRILTHLKLMSELGTLNNSALLLFAKHPEDYFPQASIKCAHFYGPRVCKPVPTHHIFRGSIFEIVDKAVDFVMSRINNYVGTRAYSNAVPVISELPREAVTEAIVNAVVHRDYNSNGSVQVMLFSDRLEIWNPGGLPYGLSVEKLHNLHPSIPVNPVLAYPVYLAGYIEELGTGTSDMIEKCLDWGLDEPKFIQDESFRVILWRATYGEPEEPVLEAGEAVYDLEHHWLEQQKRTKAQKTLFVKPTKQTKNTSVQKKQQAVIDFCCEPRSSMEIMQHIGVTRQTRTVNLYIGELIERGAIRPLIPGKPNSPKQRYIATGKHS